MPTAIVNHEPPPVPGLRTFPLPNNDWEVTGSVDALEAAGANLDFIKGAMLKMQATPTYPNIKLYPFQATGISQVAAILRRHGGAILADEMGLGKTVQGVVLGEWLRGLHSVLVVCPATVRHQWMNWANTITEGKAVLSNLGAKSDKQFKKDWFNWTNKYSLWAACSYQMMKHALEVNYPRVIIFDEPHNYLQGRGNSYAKLLWKHGAKIQYKLMLTGSPYLSKPAGLWQMLNVMFGLRFGKARDFDVRYCNGKDGTFGWENKGATHIDELSRRLKHYMVRRMKADVFTQMPKVTRTLRWVEPTTAATQAMARMEYTTNGMRQAMEPTLRAKIAEVVNVVSEVDKPCVVFCWRREDTEAVSAALDSAGEPSLVVHGEWDAAARASMIAKAGEEKKHVVTTYGASGTGLDGLQHFSSNAIFHAIDPVPATLLQAIARLDRIGQKEPVTATFIAMRESVDELLTDRVIDRLDIYQQVLGTDHNTTKLRDALMAGGLDVNNDKVMDALFKEMT